MKEYATSTELLPLINEARQAVGLPPYPHFRHITNTIIRNKIHRINLDAYHTLYNIKQAIYFFTRTTRYQKPTQEPRKPRLPAPPPTIEAGTWLHLRQLFRKVNKTRKLAGLPPFQLLADFYTELTLLDCYRIETVSDTLYRVESALYLAPKMLTGMHYRWQGPRRARTALSHQLNQPKPRRTRETRAQDRATAYEMQATYQKDRSAKRKAWMETERARKQAQREEARFCRLTARKPPEGYISAGDAAALYREQRLNLGMPEISLHTAYDHLRKMKLPYYSIGRRRFFAPSVITQAVTSPNRPRRYRSALDATAEDLASGLFMPIKDFAALANIPLKRVRMQASRRAFPSLMDPRTEVLLVHAPLAAQRFIKLINHHHGNFEPEG